MDIRWLCEITYNRAEKIGEMLVDVFPRPLAGIILALWDTQEADMKNLINAESKCSDWFKLWPHVRKIRRPIGIGFACKRYMRSNSYVIVFIAESSGSIRAITLSPRPDYKGGFFTPCVIGAEEIGFARELWRGKDVKLHTFLKREFEDFSQVSWVVL